MVNRILSFSAAVSGNTDVSSLTKNIPRITLRQLIYFSAAANQESALRASEELNVSPPAISGAIAALENLLGEQLFIRRHARGLVLTKAGQHLLSDAQDIIGRVNEIEAVRQRTPLRTLRRLMVGCLADIAPALLPPLIKKFEADNPDVEIRWHMSDHGDLMQRLEESTLDIAIVVDFEISPMLLATVLHTAPALCALAEGHRLSAGPVNLAELVDEPYIMLDIPRTRDYFLSIFGRLGLQPNIAHRASSAEMVRSLVAHGFGYSLLNFTMQRQAGITYAPLAAEPRPSNLVAVRQHRRRPSPLLEQFINQAKLTAADCHIVGA